jgi:hypothetical protein
MEALTLARCEQSLLALVQSDRDRRCDAIRENARTRVEALLREARDEARLRMRAAFGQERERNAVRVAAAAANLQTRQRLAEQQRAALLLAAGLQTLPGVLHARWRDPACRRAWVAHAIDAARGALPPRGWQIAHPMDWPAEERAELASDLASVLAAAPAFVAEPTLQAGLRIDAAGNVVDATDDGLLADQADIGAQLLDLIDR